AFVSTAADPDGDSVAIRFDWGDGDTSNWSSWAASGDTISMKHSWSDSGTYLIRAQARDTKDGTSDWSIGHQMAISGGGNGGWIRTFGGDSWDVGYSVQQTTDGGYIIAGITQSYGAGETDAYLIKTDSRGNQSWYRTFGGISWDPSYSVQQTTDGGYVLTGSTGSYGVNGDVRLIKTDAGGDTLWTRTFGDLSIDFGYSGQQTEDGGYIVAGTQYWDVGSTDVYLVKTDANGNLTWSQTYGGSSEDWGRSVRQTTDGGYVIAGDTKSYGAGEEDAYLVKTAADGGLTWSQTFGGPNRDYAASVRQTADGGYIIAGVTFSYGVGSGDVYLIKTDASGNQTWFKTFGGSAADHGYSVQQTADGGYIIVGWTHSYGAGDADVYLIKTDASGNETWFKTFGGSAADRGYSVQQTADGGYIVAGETFSYGEGLGDVYLIKTDANGNVE
ncbi:MAG: hypothetical protein JSU73_00510, partial [candidate division WOR-3 bacterium]